MDVHMRDLINRLEQDIRDHKHEVRDRDSYLLMDAQE